MKWWQYRACVEEYLHKQQVSLNYVAIVQQNSDTNRFVATLASFWKGTVFESYDVKSKWTSQYAN